MERRDLVTRASLIPVFIFGLIFGIEIYALCMVTWIFLNIFFRTPNTPFDEDDEWQTENLQSNPEEQNQMTAVLSA